MIEFSLIEETEIRIDEEGNEHFYVLYNGNWTEVGEYLFNLIERVKGMWG